jgi:hypothetical protein
LEDAFSNGASDVEACFLANISHQTLYNYQAEHPEFVERKEGLKDMIKFAAKQKVKRAIETEQTPETSKWYLERKDKEFKSKTDITTDDKPIPIYGGVSISKHDGDEKDIQFKEENKSG